MNYKIDDIMTIVEASERYGVNQSSLRNNFKPSLVATERIQRWVNEGLVKQSASTWLVTTTFMELYTAKNKLK